MSTIDVSISRYSLSVDTAQTLESLLAAADNEHGLRLLEALDIALRSTVAYAAPAKRTVTPDDVCPGAGESPDLPCLTGPSAGDLLQQLEAVGFVTARTELIEQAGTAYLSEGRAVTAVHVVAPFTVVTVDYSFSREADSRAIRYGHAYADQWDISHRTSIVPAGWYLVAEIDDIGRTPELVGVAGFDELSDDVVAWLFELEGFGASTCAAGCDSCGGRWRAESGEWTFHPEGCAAETWAFDDADDFRADTIACPDCRVGRVGFIVY